MPEAATYQREVAIPPSQKTHRALALGCWSFGGSQWGGQEDEDSRHAMRAALDAGLTHFDTATGYGGGRSERLVGEFLAQDNRRERVFLASKFNIKKDMEDASEAVDASLERLQTEVIDLYYIHWPIAGDLRPWMESLERCREAGKIKAVGVSNFSVEQMEQVAEVGRINALQVCYNLFWRFPERDVISYCREHDISVVTYSSIAQGILTGKFDRDPEFPEGDQRPKTVMFDDDVWPHVYEGVEALKPMAERAGQPLTHLAVQWVAAQPGVTSVLVGGRNAEQVRRNAVALDEPVDREILNEMTRVGDEVMEHVPDVGNIFRHYPDKKK